MRIKNCDHFPYTLVPNEFMDRFMPEANGEFVKVYLYLLRSAQREAAGEAEVSALADRLSCTENDVLRALRYWEKQGVLGLVCENGEVVSVDLHPEGAASPEAGGSGRDVPAAAVTPAAGEKTVLRRSAAEIPAESADGGAAPETPGAAPENGGNGKPARIFVSEQALSAIQNDEDFRQIVFVAETYLGRTLSGKDIQLFAYLYDELHFPEDLLEYLVEYCVGGGHRSSRYMESVALAWHQEGIRTVEQAKETHRAYSRENREIMQAFGITGRVLTREERRFVERWRKEFAMPVSVITEACGRTMTAIHQPSFEYTDKILESWHRAGVKTPAEAKSYAETRKTARRNPSREKAAASPRNRFQNYQGRSVDYDALLNQGGLNPYQSGSRNQE